MCSCARATTGHARQQTLTVPGRCACRYREPRLPRRRNGTGPRALRAEAKEEGRAPQNRQPSLTCAAATPKKHITGHRLKRHRAVAPRAVHTEPLTEFAFQTQGHVNEPYSTIQERVSLLMVFWQRRKKRFYSELICLAQKEERANLDDLCFHLFIQQFS